VNVGVIVGAMVAVLVGAPVGVGGWCAVGASSAFVGVLRVSTGVGADGQREAALGPNPTC
jgi:hypothetical protein